MPDEQKSRERPATAGNSDPIARLRQQITSVAKTSFHVLILGERGTGKELVAYELYWSSDRRDKDFLTSNVGTLESGTANSELFGHVKGAFTGAVQNREGLFRKADHGTLFLDEIGNTTLEFQGKLLRALEYREVTPVGSDNPTKVNTRVIAATNKDLDELARENKFLPDLLDRFTIKIRVPPLRECGDDSILLAEKFLQEESCRERKIGLIRLSEKARKLIRDYHWPGNGRELLNRIRQAVIEAPYGAQEWEVPAEHLQIQIGQPMASTRLAPSLSPPELPQQTLADYVLDCLLLPDRRPLLDSFNSGGDLERPISTYIAEQLELGLGRFLETEPGMALLRSRPNGAILSELFNLSRRTDARKRSFARLVRNRLNKVLQRHRELLAAC